MLLSDVSVRRPVFAIVVNLLIVCFGALSFMSLPVREMPDTDMPMVNIRTQYPGASAHVIEKRITRMIENQIAGVEGIKNISSTSRDGLSTINVLFDFGQSMDEATNDIRDRVGRVAAILPDEALSPVIGKFNPDDQPILWMNLSSPVMNRLELSDYASRYLVDRLAVVPGVANVQIGGEVRYAMRVRLKRLALAARGLTVLDVENAIRRENVELPAGQIQSTARDFTLRVQRTYKTADDFRNLVIGRGDDGHLLRLGEVADVELGAVDHRAFFRGNGETQVGIGIIKQSTANMLDVATEVKKAAAIINEGLPESLRIIPSFDSSIFVDAAITEVYQTLLIAMALVIIVIYLFLGNLKAALVPALTVPVSLIGTFIALDFMGFSINMLTLLGLVLAIGLVVDDSIVVLENCYRRVEKGESGLVAAYKGTKQVSFAVIATTLVLIGVFLPIVFVEGPFGRIFGELAVTVAAAVGISSFVALSLTAMLCSKLVRRQGRKNWLNKRLDRFFAWLSTVYEEALQVCLRTKLAMGFIPIICIVLAIAFASRLPGEFVPSEDRGFFFVMIRGAEGAGFDDMSAKVTEIEAILMRYVETGEIDRVIVQAPSNRGGVQSNMNSGRIISVLAPWHKRDRSDEALVAELQGLVAEIPGTFSTFIRNFGMRGGGADIEFVIGGPTYEDLARYRDIILEKARAHPALINVDADYRETKPQIDIEVDQGRAADLGVSVQSIGATLETMMGGKRVTTFEWKGEEYDVHTWATDEDRRTPNDISNLYVRSGRTGELIPLNNVVRLQERGDAEALNRYNRIRSVTITASLAPGAKMSDGLDFLRELVRDELPAGTPVAYKGMSEDFMELMLTLLFSMGLGIAVVYLILAAQFESFVHPGVIMLSIFTALFGGVFGLYVFGGALNIYSGIGIVILIGLAAKNGILIVEFTNQLRDEGYEFSHAVTEAAKIRMRPVLMTGISTAMGTLPLVLASGPGAGSRSSIGVVIFAGVVISTFLTLFIVPALYAGLARNTKSPGYMSALLTKALKDDAESRSKGQQPAE